MPAHATGVPEHRSIRACPHNGGVGAPIRTWLLNQQECRSTSRSAGAPIRMCLLTQQECRSTNRSTGAPIRTCLLTQQECRSTSRSVGAPIKTWLPTQQKCRSTNRSAEAPTGRPLIHFLVLGSHMIICLSVHFHISYTYTGILMYSHIIHVFLSLDASTFLRNWNNSN